MELPVGIEKEMIVVNLPVKHAYVDSEESLKTTDELKLLKKIAAVDLIRTKQILMQSTKRWKRKT